MSVNLRAASKCEYSPLGPNPTYNELQIGALQRIADATEKMAYSHSELIRQRDEYKMRLEDSRKRAEKLSRQMARLRKYWSAAGIVADGKKQKRA